MKISFAPEAEADFLALIEYLRERNPSAATALGERIFSVVDQLAAGEFEGTERELVSGERVRSFAVPPVRIYYQRTTNTLWVLRVYDQRQRSIER